MPKSLHILLLTLFLLSAMPAGAQRVLGRMELGLTGGGMNYLGDLNNQSLFGQVNLAGGLMARYNLDTRWALSAGVAYGHISGGNPDAVPLRNLSFRSPIGEALIRAEFNFFPYGLKPGTQHRFTPFLFCGIGMLRFNPQAQYLDTAGHAVWADLQPLATEGQGTQAYPDRNKYSLTEVVMPFGIGVRWQLSSAWHLAAEYGFRKTWTDYLDDVSTTYVGADVLTAVDGGGDLAVQLADRSGEVREGYVNAAGIKRGDDSLNDWYSYFNITLSCSMEVLFGWMRGKTCER